MYTLKFLNTIHMVKLPRIIFGVGSIRGLGEACKFYGSNCLVVSDSQISKLPLFKEVLKELESVNVTYEVYDKVETEPSIENAREVTSKS